jgi:putative DNA primase/helicase
VIHYIEAKLSARPKFFVADPLIPGASFLVTFFGDQYAKAKAEKIMTAYQLRDLILDTTAPSKEALPWLKLALFGDARAKSGSLRHDDNVIEVYGVELDYDAKEMSFDAAVEIIKRNNLRCIIYTSPSYTPEGPKWRVLAPTTRSVSPERRDELVRTIDRLFSMAFAKESYTLSQSYYYGSVDSNPAHRCEVYLGYCVDQLVTDELLDYINARLAEMEYPGNVHELELSCSASMLNRGASIDDTVAKVVDAAMAAAERAGENWDREKEEETVRRMCEDWLKKHPQPDTPRPIIKVIAGDIARVVDEAEGALIAAGVPIMTRAGTLVRPIKETFDASNGHKTEQTVLHPVHWQTISYLLNKHAATFMRFDGRLKQWVRIDPPENVAKTLLTKRQWTFPKVKGVITAPTMRADGSLIDRPGYDATTQLWYEPDGFLQVPAIKEQPTKEEALAALKLFEDLIVGFPFEKELDHAVALAALLTPLLRAACDVVPMTLFLAHVAGSGKSFLIDLISTIATGRRAPAIEKAENREELEKRLGALVLAGVPIVNIDNCVTNLSGVTLCQLTERELVRIRVLGKSEMPECEYRGSVFANGNNITAEGDLTRRTLVSHIDPVVERPELRRFDFDPIARVLHDRGSYIAAALTVARGYRVSGAAVTCTPIASYGRWSRTVREPLIWLGKEDPVKSMDELREEDPELTAIATLFELWEKLFGVDIPRTAAELADEAHKQGHEALHTLLVTQCGERVRGYQEISVKSLGIWLRKIHGRVYAGLRLMKVKNATERRGATYTLQRV